MLGATALATAIGVAAIGCGSPAATPIHLDKCYGPDTPEGQPGAPPMKASQDPEIQPVTNCFKESCGGIDWFVNFALPVPAATDGWIVQEVVYKNDVTGPEALPAQDHYWAQRERHERNSDMDRKGEVL